MSKAKYKPLSFTTTLRNPERIPDFLRCLSSFEGEILSNDLIHKIVKKIINEKIYTTVYEKNHYKNILNSEKEFTEEQLEEIIVNSPQEHKEAGFDYGWPSRFDTWFKICKELGFTDYSIDHPIFISRTGHMLIQAYNEKPANSEKIQMIFLNAFMKYQTNNPYRRVLNANLPLSLLLRVIKNLREDDTRKNSGIYRGEIPIFLCWPDNDDKKLSSYLKELREEHGFNYSEDLIYEKCLEILNTNKRTYIKKEKICGESTDEYIRKMRMTGILSLRGKGRFIDINAFEQEKVDYIIKNYSSLKNITDENEHFKYLGEIDEFILKVRKTVAKDNLETIRKKALKNYAKSYNREIIFRELKILETKKSSKDDFLKLIPEPTRLEFLTSVALVQNFKGLDVSPNYCIDDEGNPTFTASGGLADIECFDKDYDSYFEVTLMRSRSDQVNNEMIPISRHLKQAKENRRQESFSVFIAPVIHEDVRTFIEFAKYKDNLDIVSYSISDFVSNIATANKSSDLLKNNSIE